jgi:hypothetical protein
VTLPSPADQWSVPGGRRIDAFDDDHVETLSCRFEPQPELLLDGREQVGSIGIRGIAGLPAVRLEKTGEGGGKGNGNEAENNAVALLQSGFIEDGATREATQKSGESGHRRLALVGHTAASGIHRGRRGSWSQRNFDAASGQDEIVYGHFSDLGMGLDMKTLFQRRLKERLYFRIGNAIRSFGSKIEAIFIEGSRTENAIFRESPGCGNEIFSG